MVRTEKTVRTETADGERCRKGLPDAGACSERCNAAWRRLMRYWGTPPAYYAGAYIRDGRLCVLLTTEDAAAVEGVLAGAGTGDVAVRRAQYSRRQLCEVFWRLHAAVFAEKPYPVVGLGIDEAANRVVAEVLCTAPENETLRRIAAAYPCVEIVCKDEAYRPASRIGAGTADWICNPLGGASTVACCGSRASRGGAAESGLVIAGHGGCVGDVMRIGGEPVGTVTRRVYGGPLDAAFVRLDRPDAFELSRALSGGYTLSGWREVGLVGTAYTLHGMSSGIAAGTVDSRCFSFVMDGKLFYNMIRMRITAVCGDSGAPLTAQLGQHGGMNREIVGIYSGGDAEYGNFSKFSVFRRTFGFTLA